MQTTPKAVGLGALALLCGCAAPDAPDTEAPTVLASVEGARAPFFASSAEVAAANTACPGALSAAYAVFPPGSELVHVREGGATSRLSFTFSDPSGIAQAFLQIPDGTLRTPNVSKKVPIPTPSGDLSEVFEYTFFSQTDPPAETHSVSVDLTHGDANRVFSAFAVDGAGNRSDTLTIVVGEAANLCA